MCVCVCVCVCVISTQGKVTLQTYVSYLRAGSASLGAASLLLLALGQLLSMATDYWLR